MKVLVTGCAGFIGFHLVKKLLDTNISIIGVDNINSYYDQKLKKNRLQLLESKALKNKKKYFFIKANLCNKKKTEQIFKKFKPNIVVHLAAQAGVRYSLKAPVVYAKNNVVGFTNVLENCRLNKIKQLIYASSSSVYGANTKVPFNENHNTDHPLQYYAATKKSNEVMAFAYSSLYKLPIVGVRFFTVYGSYGRPDMALYKFTKNIFQGKTIKVHNNGNHSRDFTHVNDISAGIIKLFNCFDKKNIKKKVEKILINKIPHFIINFGNSKPVKLKNFIKILENTINKKAKIKLIPFQSGEVINTYADIRRAKKLIGYNNKIDIKKGAKDFVEWFKKYYNL